MSFIKGQEVTQVLPAPITGVVEGFALDQNTGAVTVLVSSTDDSGEVHQRYFQQSEIA